jgi:hypothetical protein
MIFSTLPIALGLETSIAHRTMLSRSRYKCTIARADIFKLVSSFRLDHSSDAIEIALTATTRIARACREPRKEKGLVVVR